MKNIYSFLLCFATISAYAQNWDWAKNIDQGAQESGGSLGMDKQNNLFILGSTEYFTGSGGNSYSYPLFYKFNSSGNLLWMDTLAFSGEQFAIDSIGNTYFASGNIIAKYNSSGQKLWIKNIPNAAFWSATINPVTGFIAVGSAPGNRPSLVYSFDSNGNCLWSKIDSSFYPSHVICDKAGNTYTIGWRIMKFDVLGNMTFVVQHPSATYNDLEVDNEGNIYASGWFSAIPFTIGGTTYYANNKVNQFIIKYDPLGNLLWYKILSGSLTTCTSISLDVEDNVYFTSCYTSLNVDSYSLTCSKGQVFVMKLDSTGTIQWLQHSTEINGEAGTSDIVVAPSNEIFITGSTGYAQPYSHSFGSTTINKISGYPDMLIAKLSNSHTTSFFEQQQSTNSLQIFPNPTSGIFNINYSSAGSGKLTLKVTNAKGQTIYEEIIANPSKEYQKEIDLSKHAKGVYFIELITSRGKEVRKIILE